MDRPDLPPPVTRTDRILHDIATSLRTLVDRDAEPAPAEGTVRLQEPAVPRPPEHGKGSGRDAWAAYVRSIGGLDSDCDTRDDLINLANSIEAGRRDA